MLYASELTTTSFNIVEVKKNPLLYSKSEWFINVWVYSVKI